MGFRQKLGHEIKAILLTTAYFAVWFGALLLLKNLILAEYDLELQRMSVALIGALIVAKVVLILEHVPLGSWLGHPPAWVDVVLRTLLYSVGVVLVLLCEKAIEGRHEHGGIGPALRQVFDQADIHHVWATTIGVCGALLVFNGLTVLRRSVGDRALVQAFLKPCPARHSNSEH